MASLDFGTSGGRDLVGAFDGGAITSNGGVLLLGAADRVIKLTERAARCFRDLRSPEWIRHPLDTLIRQRVFGVALAYEDLIDHDQLRHDPVFAAAPAQPARRRHRYPTPGEDREPPPTDQCLTEPLS